MFEKAKLRCQAAIKKVPNTKIGFFSLVQRVTSDGSPCWAVIRCDCRYVAPQESPRGQELVFSLPSPNYRTSFTAHKREERGRKERRYRKCAVLVLFLRDKNCTPYVLFLFPFLVFCFCPRAKLYPPQDGESSRPGRCVRKRAAAAGKAPLGFGLGSQENYQHSFLSSGCEGAFPPTCRKKNERSQSVPGRCVTLAQRSAFDGFSPPPPLQARSGMYAPQSPNKESSVLFLWEGPPYRSSRNLLCSCVAVNRFF